ncbi:ricin-type beta-trefoil lectin domain protein [Kitasatospora sp. MMS16-BH015]|uniref:ricin-type beta-trefoil lectin domain protein n=1 Tax=Kitasatospora sp. MMS16-BH015 TaxID=2018025 RepID=UPI000CF2E1F1|nr:ricin-type beta-trefoil lectin domain protein [Kitasatospora sp. MMS16-BH015]
MAAIAALGLTTGLLAAAPAAWAASPTDPNAAIAAADAAHAKDTPPAPGFKQAGEDEGSKALAQAKATGKDVPVPSLTTEFSETVATPAGHFNQTQHPLQQRTRKNGAWQDLDATLATTADGTVTPKTAASGLALSGGGTGPLATMTTADGKQLAISAPFASLPAPTLDGTTALYPNVAPDTDLRVSVSKQGGFSTVLIVKTPQAAANPVVKNLKFATKTKGVTIAADQGGNLKATDAKGQPVFSAPAPLMWDSSADASKTAAAPKTAARSLAAAPAAADLDAAAPAGAAAPVPGRANGKGAASTPDGPGTGAKLAQMPVSTAGTTVGLTADQSILTDSTTKYPVYIDPAWVPATIGKQQYTWTQQAFPNTSNLNKSSSADIDHPGVGYQGWSSPYGIERAYYQFDVSGYKGVVVNSATLHAEEYMSSDWSCTNSYGVNAYLSASFDGNTTWNNSPARYDSLGSRNVPGAGQNGCYNNVGVDWDATTVVKNGLGAGWNVAAFTLQGDEGNRNAFKRFDYNASLSIQYDRVPNVPTNPHTGPVSPHTVNPAGSTDSCNTNDLSTWGWLNSDTASLNVNVSSSAQSQLAAWVHIWDYGQSGTPEVSSGTTGLVNSGSDASWQLPAGSLKDGHWYGWGGFATDTLPGVGWAQFSPDCHFRVDRTAPTVTFPSTVTDLTKQFPMSGNGQVPQLYAGQTGLVPFTATDPNPSGLQSSGLACLRWSFDPQLAGAQWQCGGAIPSAGISVTPARWGTNVLYVQAEDNAGNLSQVSSYSFYAPWNPNGPAPAFGDMTGDSSPDILVRHPDGGLYTHNAPASTQAGSAAVSLTALPADSPGGDSWANYQVTHRGSLRGSKNVDDVLAHKNGGAVLTAYLNPGNNVPTGRINTKIPIQKPACAVTTLNPSCAGYFATDWSTTKQVLAIGDPAHSALGTNKAYQDRTGLLSIEAVGSTDAALWYYPTTSDTTLGQPVRLASTGWLGRDLISPGDWNAKGRPGVWARSANGDVTAYNLTVAQDSTTDEFGTATPPWNTVSAIDAGTTIGNVPVTPWAVVGSEGDLTGDGLADLWALDPVGNTLQIWPGHTATAGGKAVTDLAAPYQLGSTNLAADEWRLTGATNSVTPDATGQHAGTVKGGVTFPSDTVAGRTTTVAALSGGAAEIDTAGTSLDISKSFTVSLWAKPTALGSPVVSQDGTSASGFMVWPEGSDGTWRFGMGRSDDNGWNYDQTDYRSAAAKAQPNVWTKLTASYNATTNQMNLWVNGILAGSGYHTTQSGITGPVVLGRYKYQGAANSFYTGSISDLAVYNTPTVPAGAPSKITNGVAANRCLDDSQGALTDGNAVQIWDCNGSAPQQWTAMPDGSLQVLGHCLDDPQGNSASGTVTQLWTCNGSAAQKWLPRADGSIVNSATGKCLDMPQGNVTSGTRPQLWDCNGTPAQQWTFTPMS